MNQTMQETNYFTLYTKDFEDSFTIDLTLYSVVKSHNTFLLAWVEQN